METTPNIESHLFLGLEYTPKGLQPPKGHPEQEN